MEKEITGYVAWDDGNWKLVLKCPCTCWYCLCTREGHCGKNKCDKQKFHPEDETRRK